MLAEPWSDQTKAFLSRLAELYGKRYMNETERSELYFVKESLWGTVTTHPTRRAS